MGKRNQQLNSEGDVLKHIIASLDLPPIPVAQSVVAARSRKSAGKFRRPDWGEKFIGLYQGSSTIEKIAADQIDLVSSGLPELPAGYRLKEQQLTPVLAQLVVAVKNQRDDLVVVGATFYGLTRILDQISGFIAATKKMLSLYPSEIANRRVAEKIGLISSVNGDRLSSESLPKIARKILRKASTDSDLRSALFELNDLKMRVRTQQLSPENMGCSGKVLEAILKSAKAVQCLK